jgi:hypothetical protein
MWLKQHWILAIVIAVAVWYLYTQYQNQQNAGA